MREFWGDQRENTYNYIHQEYSFPLLGFASDAHLVAKKKVILMPDFEAQKGYSALFKIINIATKKYPWSKKIPYVFWRGSATGADFNKDPLKFPRLQFMDIVVKNHNYIDAGFTYYVAGKKQKKLYLYLTKNFSIAEVVSPEDSLLYKYLLDIDGFSCSYSRMAWILNSNSLLLKVQSNKIQWYYNKLQPYVHYVPIRQDFSDLRSQYELVEANQGKIQLIITNARKLAAEIFNQDALDLATRKAFVDYYELTQK